MKKFWILLLLLFYFLISFNWSISLTTPDEGKNASAVLNMIKTKNFLVPFYNCEPRIKKPPLLYWTGTITSSIFGLNEFSLRLVSGISAITLLLFVYLIAKEFFETSIALRSLLIFLTFPHLWIEARSFTPEMLLNLFSVGAIYFFIKNKTLIGWLFLAFAFLTKGPVGIILPLGVILIFKFIKKDFQIFNFWGVILFLLIGFPWYFYMFYKFGFFYIYKFFIKENVFRYIGKIKVHPYPFYFYILLILATSILYLPIYFNVFRNLRNLKEKKFLPFSLWFGFVLLFYSLSKNKLHHYILFAYPPLCIILANFTSETYIKRIIFISGIIFLALVSLLKSYEKNRFIPQAKNILKNYPGEIYFFKTEVSPLPFYLQKCIPKLNLSHPLSSSMIITTKKYENKFKNCKKILEGKEFERSFVLLECDFKGHN